MFFTFLIQRAAVEVKQQRPLWLFQSTAVLSADVESRISMTWMKVVKEVLGVGMYFSKSTDVVWKKAKTVTGHEV